MGAAIACFRYVSENRPIRASAMVTTVFPVDFGVLIKRLIRHYYTGIHRV